MEGRTVTLKPSDQNEVNQYCLYLSDSLLPNSLISFLFLYTYAYLSCLADTIYQEGGGELGSSIACKKVHLAKDAKVTFVTDKDDRLKDLKYV